eukprot:870363-Rhodomonas_salina.2
MSVRAGSTVGLGIEWSVSEFRLFVTLGGVRQPETVPLSDDKGKRCPSHSLFTTELIRRQPPRYHATHSRQTSGANDSVFIGRCQVVVNFGAQPFTYQDEGVNAALEKRKREAEAAKP